MKTNFQILSTLYALFFILLSIPFTGCVKNEKFDDNPNKIPDVNSTDVPTVRSSGNPVDYVGEWHNAALDSIAAHYDNVGNATDAQKWDLILAAFIANSPNVTVTLALNDYDSDPIAESHTTNIDADSLMEWVHSHEDSFNLVEKNYIREMDFILANASSIGDVDEDLADLVDEVLNDNSSMRTNMLLGAISILHHSSNYWENVRNHSGNPWYGSVFGFNSSEIKERFPWQLIYAAIRDVAGYLDCYINGGWGGNSSNETINSVCGSAGAYSSSRP